MYITLHKLLIHPMFSIIVISKCNVLASPGDLSKILMSGQPLASLPRKASDLLNVLCTKSDLHILLYMCYVCQILSKVIQWILVYNRGHTKSFASQMNPRDAEEPNVLMWVSLALSTNRRTLDSSAFLRSSVSDHLFLSLTCTAISVTSVGSGWDMTLINGSLLLRVSGSMSPWD